MKYVFALAALILGAGPALAQTVSPAVNLSAQLETLTYRVRSPGVGPGHILVIGDSLTDNMYYSQACGDLVVKLGISGMRAHDFAPFISEIMAIVQPSDVVIELGKNDMVASTYNQFVQDYWAVVLAVRAAGVSPVLLTIIPTEAATDWTVAAYNNPPLLAQFNAYIKAVGMVLGARVQDDATALAPGGYLPPGSTYLGLHPLGNLSKLLWWQYEDAIETSRLARGLDCQDINAPLVP